MSDRLVGRLAKGRVYYGWYIVGVVLASGIPRVGLNGHFFGIFLKPMSEEFGWTRADTTLAVTIGTLMAAASAIYLGKMLDRFGPRWMMAGGFALLVASYFGLAKVSTLIGFYLVFAIGRSIMQGATGHAMMYALVSKWFVRRRATAISAATVGGYIGGIFLAPATQSIIDNVSWRVAWTFFGGITIVLALIPAIFLLRRIPEDLGLLPDGDTVPAALPQGSVGEAEAGIAPSAETSLSRQEALHTPAFWLLTVMLTVNSVATTGITFHMVPHFSDVGISNTAAAASVSFMTAGSIVSVFAWGYLSDRLGAKRMLLLGIATMWVATYVVAETTTVLGAYAGSALFGVGLAGSGLLSEVVWAEFFGRRYLGSIRGATIPFQMAGNATGSLLAAFLFDLRANYDDAFKVILVFFAVSMALLAIARRPRISE